VLSGGVFGSTKLLAGGSWQRGNGPISIATPVVIATQKISRLGGRIHAVFPRIFCVLSASLHCPWDLPGRSIIELWEAMEATSQSGVELIDKYNCS